MALVIIESALTIRVGPSFQASHSTTFRFVGVLDFWLELAGRLMIFSRGWIQCYQVWLER